MYNIHYELDNILNEYLEKMGKLPLYILITNDQYVRLLGITNYTNRIMHEKEIEKITSYRGIMLINQGDVATNLFEINEYYIPTPIMSDELIYDNLKKTHDLF